MLICRVDSPVARDINFQHELPSVVNNFVLRNKHGFLCTIQLYQALQQTSANVMQYYKLTISISQ